MSDGRQRRWWAALLVAAAIVIAAVEVVIWLAGGSSSPAHTSTATRAGVRGRAPASVSIPADLARAAAAGIASDGWARKQARLQLAGGPAAALVIRGTTPVEKQSLEIVVDGTPVASGRIAVGRFQVHAPLPPSPVRRDVGLRFARVRQLKAPDPRREAARLSYVGLAGGVAPVSISFPHSAGSAPSSGLFADGWATRRSAFLLAGGGAAVLAIAGEVPLMPAQHVRVAVGQAAIFDGDITPGRLDLRLPLVPSRANRYVEIEFTRSTHLTPPDSRSASAQLTRVQVAPLSAPRAMTFPEALQQSRGAFAGFYPDGWARRDVRFAIGGGCSSLRVELQNLIHGQTASFLIDGRRYATRPTRVGTTTYVLHVQPSAGARVVAIHFAKVAPISANDARRAAALLQVASTS